MTPATERDVHESKHQKRDTAASVAAVGTVGYLSPEIRREYSTNFPSRQTYGSRRILHKLRSQRRLLSGQSNVVGMGDINPLGTCARCHIKNPSLR